MRATDPAPPTVGKANNSFTSTPPYASMTWCLITGTTFLLLTLSRGIGSNGKIMYAVNNGEWPVYGQQ